MVSTQSIKLIPSEKTSLGTLTDFLPILFMVMFLYITPLHIFRDFVMKMHRNGTKWYHNQSGLLWTSFFICEKQSPGGTAVGKFRKIFKTMISPLLNRFQGWHGYQIKRDSSRIVNLLPFCAKIWLYLNKIQKTSKDHAIFCLISAFF